LVCVSAMRGSFFRGKSGHHKSAENSVEITMPTSKPKLGHSKSGETYEVQAGAQIQVGTPSGPQGVSQAMVLDFFPKVVQVRQGDWISLTTMDAEPHAFVFGSYSGIQLPMLPYAPVGGQLGLLNPIPASGPYIWDGVSLMSSGIWFGGPSFTFQMMGGPGLYRYRCSIHTNMIGFIQVVANGERPSNPSKGEWRHSFEKMYTEQANWVIQSAVFQSWLDQQNPSVLEPSSFVPNIYEVAVGTGLPNIAVMLYFPSVLNVPVGSVVRFVNRDPSIQHTVSINSNPCMGPPELLNLFPCGSTTLTSPSDYYNSGWMSPFWIPGSPSYVELTFNGEGTYPVYCGIHGDIGMTMVINVGGSPV